MTLDSIEIDGAGYTIAGDSITLSAPTGLFTTYGAGVSALNINTTLVGGQVDIAGGGTLDIDGVITGNVGFNVSGGGILAGTGQVTALSVQSSTVQPGLLGVGNLVVQGGATFSSDSTFSTQIISPTANSALAAIGGTTVLDQPALVIGIALGVVPAPGSTFTIIQGSVSGTFAGDPEGASIPVGGSTFRISYHQGVTLTAVVPTTIQTTVQGGTSTSNFGQSVTFVATISSAGGSPTGTVTFEDSGSILGTGPVNSGVATFTTTKLAIGPHAITTVYSGDSKFAASTSPVLDVTVNQDNTKTTVTSSSTPERFWPDCELHRKGGPGRAGAGTPTGTVDFFDGTTMLSEVTLVGGTASFSTTLSLGNHAIAAVYNGDDNFITSFSPAISQNVNQANTTSNLTSSANPSVFGQTVSFTAQVSAAAPGAGAPTGTVTFLDGTTELGTVALTVGSATIETSDLTRGSHSITVKYNGDTDFLASTSAVTPQNVNQATTQTVVTPLPSASIVGQNVTFTAQVSAVSPGGGTPTGSVDFFDGATDLGTVALTAGAASISTSTLALGSHSITAKYSGDTADFLPSTSDAIVENVGGTTVVLASSMNPSTAGQSVTFTATVSADASGSTVPTGSVTFMDGTQTLGVSGIDESGVATFSTESLIGGTHAITAVYGGATDFAGSTSNQTNQVVNRAPTTTTLVLSVSQGTFGESVSFTATVTVDGQGALGGSVTFKDGSTVLATVDTGIGFPGPGLGVAIYSTGGLTVGSHSIVAVYNGTDSAAPSTSSSQSITVSQSTTTTTLTSSTSAPAAGQLVTLTATIAPVAPGAAPPRARSFSTTDRP